MKKITLLFTVFCFVAFASNLQAQSKETSKTLTKEVVSPTQEVQKNVVPTPEYRLTPTTENRKSTKIGTPAYLDAKAKFKQQNPNATRKEINKFLSDWN